MKAERNSVLSWQLQNISMVRSFDIEAGKFNKVNVYM
jgi:hypothetical protein